MEGETEAGQKKIIILMDKIHILNVGLKMGEGLKKLFYSASNVKNTILENRNIDILLFLAKYNPKITRQDIVKNFGEESLDGLKHLEMCNLIREEGDKLSLTEEGIFQVEGLVSIAV